VEKRSESAFMQIVLKELRVGRLMTPLGPTITQGRAAKPDMDQSFQDKQLFAI
jgi:hypothetical protein